MASAIYEGFKVLLRTLERTSDVFPPLKTVVAGLVVTIELIEVLFPLSDFALIPSPSKAKIQNTEDRIELTTSLEAILSILNARRHDWDKPHFATRLAHVSR